MLKKNFLLLLVFALTSGSAFAQGRYYTKTGTIIFYSKAPLEDIEAINKTVTAVIDSKSGAVQFSVPMKGFEFEKKMMQEHFNENYVESDTYPKGEFRGTITNNAAVNYAKDGSYPARISGKLTIHGVTKSIETNGTIRVAAGKLDADATFNILLSDYKIKIPALVKEKVSNSVKIVVDCSLDPLKS